MPSSRRVALDPLVVQAKKQPYLTAEREAELARAWRDRQDKKALDELVRSHLRLVVARAQRWARHAPLEDLIAEGSAGLVKAAHRFDPDLGYRFATCAIHWVDSAVRDHVIALSAPFKVVTTAAHRRMFFGLGPALARHAGTDDPNGMAAQDLGVTRDDVMDMRGRLMELATLDRPIKPGGSLTLLDTLTSDTDIEDEHAEAEEDARRRRVLHDAVITRLDPRERIIIEARWLGEGRETLDALAIRLGVSKERVRQLEVRAIGKLKAAAQGREPSRRGRPAKDDCPPMTVSEDILLAAE